MEIGISLNSFRDKRVLYNGACNGKYEIVSLGRPFFFFLQFPATNFILERLSLCLERIKRIWNATFGWNVSRDRHVCETSMQEYWSFLEESFFFLEYNWDIFLLFLFVYSWCVDAILNLFIQISLRIYRVKQLKLFLNFSAILSRRKAFEV